MLVMLIVNYGGYIYQLNVQQDGLYRIEVSPGVRSFVYVYGAEVLPDQQGYYAFSNGSSPLIYLAGSANQEFTIKVEKEDFTVSNVNYNNNAGAKLGKNNSVTLQLSKTSAGTGTYQVSLYCAGSAEGEGGLRSQPQEVTLNGSAPVSLTFDNVALYGGGTGTIYTYVKVSLEQNGVGADSNRIQNTINGVLPQEIKFSNAGNRTNEHVIFDDHPEFIRECDLLDSAYFSPAVINHVDNLQPGNTYTLFSYHHIANSYSDERYRKGENNTIPANQDVYFDIVFHGTGRVAVKKIGYACGGIEERPWELLNSAFPNFNSSSLDYKIDLSGEDKFLSDEGFFGSSLLKINEKDNEGIGYGHVILQFEVESGSVNISTVAYKNKGSVTTPGTAKANFSGTIKSVYEDLETLKGMADSTQVMASDILNYVIDDSVQSNLPLPFIVKNQIYPEGRKNGIFSTNSSPLTENNSYMTPLSSVPVLKYYGDGVMRNETSGNVQTTVLLDTETPWIFDSSHSRFVKNYELTEEMKFGPYENKISFSANEPLSEVWMGQLATLTGNANTNVFNELDGLSAGNLQNGKGIVSVNPGFGHTYEINIRIQNSGTEPRRLNYYLYGGVSHVSWRYAVCNPTVGWSQAWTENISLVDGDNPKIDAETGTKKIFSNDLVIPAGKCINLQLWLTIYTGSIPVIQNAIVIDPISEFEIELGELASGYPQN